MTANDYERINSLTKNVEDSEELREQDTKLIKSQLNRLSEKIDILEDNKSYLIRSIAIAVALLFLMATVVILLYTLYPTADLEKLFLAWMIGSATLIVIATVFFLSITANANKLFKEILSAQNIGIKNMIDSIRINLTPTVYAHSTIADVALTASRIIEKAMNEDKLKNRYVYYYGALNLSSIELDESFDETIEVNTYVGEYRKLQNQLIENKISVKRFINLLEPIEVKDRNPKIKRNYKNWLSKQITNYSVYCDIIKAKRAPSFADGNSYIITHQSYLHVTGDGEAAIHVSSPELVKIIRDKMSQFISKAEVEKNKPKPLTKNQLEDYFDKISPYLKG